MSQVSNAVDLFQKGCACSQAILAVYGGPLGLDRTQAMRIASGFAGGMCMAETCGAVTGALMALGLRHCGGDCTSPSDRATTCAAVREFISRFKAGNGSVTCKGLLGCDITTAEGAEVPREQDLFKTKCPKLVEDAAVILEELL